MNQNTSTKDLNGKQELFCDLTGENEVKRNNALKVIYRDCFPSVKSFIMNHNGNEQDAFDIFQDGVLSLYQNVLNGKFKKGSSVKTYLFAICKNKWFSRHKMKVREQKILEMDFQDDDTMEVDADLIRKMMNDLKPECVDVLVGFYFQHMSIRMLRIKYGLGSDQAAKNKKFRCLRYLINIVRQKGLSYENFVLNK